MARGEEWRRRMRQAKAARAAAQRTAKGRYRRRDPYAQAQPVVIRQPPKREEEKRDG